MSEHPDLQFRLTEADQQIADYVYCFSAFTNPPVVNEGIIIPNGKIDLVLSLTASGVFKIALLGLEARPKTTPEQELAKFFSISFQPLAVEYILKMPVADLLNSGKILPDDFWGFNISDLDHFDTFCQKATHIVQALIPLNVDRRKKNLFLQIIAAEGNIVVSELSDQLGWSARQINHYFNRQLGVSLKTYCNILRFQASLKHIRKGQLYPQLNYTDQSHFIKEVKKMSGVSPKELSKNENSRFLQFLVYGKE